MPTSEPAAPLYEPIAPPIPIPAIEDKKYFCGNIIYKEVKKDVIMRIGMSSNTFGLYKDKANVSFQGAEDVLRILRAKKENVGILGDLFAHVQIAYEKSQVTDAFKKQVKEAAEEKGVPQILRQVVEEKLGIKLNVTV